MGISSWANIWIYLVADFAGGAVAAGAFNALNPAERRDARLPNSRETQGANLSCLTLLLSGSAIRIRKSLFLSQLSPVWRSCSYTAGTEITSPYLVRFTNGMKRTLPTRCTTRRKLRTTGSIEGNE
jgi:hypothetical protein